ncbi:MAG: hypothetical protein IJU33_01745 [Bacteroidales bacterium]|nr:hypothetical protein [Bacteroidales bacterium]
MKKIWLLIIFWMAFLAAVCQNYSAKVYDGVTYIPVAGAHVYNTKTGKYVFTDKEGKFSIMASVNDTLIISKSIYRQLIVPLNSRQYSKKNEDYFLYYKAVILKEVKVYALNPSYEGFKRDLIGVKLPDAYRKIEGIELSKEDKLNAELAHSGPNVLRNTPLEHPITMLYNMFSRKAKMQRLYNELVENEDEIDQLQMKYNRDLVHQITGLEGDALMEFMVFCRFSYYDLLRWTPQQVIINIKNKYIEYQYYKAQQYE